MWKSLVTALALVSFMQAGSIVYEDAESGDTAKWSVLDDIPPGASINRIYDEELKSNVIELKGDREQNSFLLANEDGSLWNDKEHFIIEWKQKSDSSFVIYVMTRTTDGNRYITFCNCPKDREVLRMSELSFGLGKDADDGKWHTFKINLVEKLHKLLPDTDLLSVEGLIVRGSGRFDDIILSDGKEEPEVSVPKAPGNVEISNSTPTSITLNWEDLSDNEEGFHIYRNEELIATVEENMTTYTDTNLSADTVYKYEIKAFNKAGESEGESIEVQTPKEVVIPTAPANLKTEVNSTSVTLKWEDTSDNESGFEIYKNDLLIATTAPDTTTYIDNNITAGEEYLYTVKAVNEAGQSEGVSLTVKIPKESTPPKAPSDLNATEITSNSVTLVWSDNSDNETGFKIIRDGEVIATLDDNTATYTDINLSSNTSYTYIVIAVNEEGESESEPLTVTTKEKIIELSAPANLTFTDITPHSITLVWEDTTDNETGFKIIRDGEVIATVEANVTTYTDTNLTAGQEYEYQVVATNGEVDSLPVSEKVKTDLGVPKSVTDLKAEVNGTDSITLTWTDSSEDEKGFKVLRDGEVIATLEENSTSYTDTNLSPDTEYEYAVVAFNDYGDSTPAKVKAKTGEDPVMTYVRYLYNTVLEREPEDEGLGYWTQRLKEGDSAAAVAKGFFVLTHELQDKNLSNEEYIKKIYITLYQRKPLAGELSYWTKILDEGILNRDLVFDKLVYTNEFIKLAKSYHLKPFDETDMLYSRIESLYYLILGRKGSYGEVEYWVRKLQNNQTTYEQIIKNFFFSKEFQNRKLSDEDFVKAAYRTILNREPERMGLEYWTKRLQEDLTREELIDYIFNSPEYKFISDIKA